MMSKAEFLRVMQFPREWAEWEMYPDALFELQVATYAAGHEEGSEHDRSGAFHWWLRQEPGPEILVKLAKLSHLDTDSYLAEDVRNYIRKSQHYNAEVAEYC